jgi:hypothetical protein
MYARSGPWNADVWVLHSENGSPGSESSGRTSVRQLWSLVHTHTRHTFLLGCIPFSRCIISSRLVCLALAFVVYFYVFYPIPWLVFEFCIHFRCCLFHFHILAHNY